MENTKHTENKNNVVLSARHLKKTFRSGDAEQTIINDLNLEIRKGDLGEYTPDNAGRRIQ